MFIMFMFAALVSLVAALVAGGLLIIRLMIKHPILGVPIVAYIGLAMWLGSNDAQALTCYALIALGLWRLAHKDSFQRLVGRLLRSSRRRLGAYDSPPERDAGAGGSGEASPAPPARLTDPTCGIRAVG